MGMNVFTDAELVDITGPVLIRKNPKTGEAGALTVTGTSTFNGQVVAASGLSVAGTLSGVSLTAASQLTAATGISITAGGETITAGGMSITAGGLTVTTNASNFDQIGGGCTSIAGIATTSAGTVSTSTRVSKVSPAGAVTSCVMATGTFPGQTVTVLNEQGTAANAVSFAITSGASNLADAASTVAISGGKSRVFTWDPFTATWF